MDPSKLFLTQSVSNPQQLNNNRDVDKLSEQQKKELAKEFESVLMEKMMSQMKKTTGCLSQEDSASSEQIKDLFWSQLGKDLSSKGGLGLWKDVYQFLSETSPDKPNGSSESIDKSV